MTVADDPERSERGRRCAAGCESWPPTSEFKTCPVCGEPTKLFSNLQPLDPEEALKRKRWAQFNDWLDAHGRR